MLTAGLVGGAGVARADFNEAYIVDGRLILPPETLDGAVATVRQLYEAGANRREIAEWIQAVVDARITNMNTLEIFADWRNLIFWRSEIPGQRLMDEWRARNEFDHTVSAPWAWENRMGNCEENAAVVYYILRHAGVREPVRLIYAGAHHTFPVWGIAEGADPNQPSTWGDDAIAIDSWYGGLVDPEVIDDSYWFRRDQNTILVDGTANHDRSSTPWEVDPIYREFETEPIAGDCFVAGAVYGTPLASQVQVLRQYRDGVLRRRPAGRAFLAWYGRWGPVLAAWLGDHPAARPAVRRAVVAPAVEFARRALRT